MMTLSIDFSQWLIQKANEVNPYIIKANNSEEVSPLYSNIMSSIFFKKVEIQHTCICVGKTWNDILKSMNFLRGKCILISTVYV